MGGDDQLARTGPLERTTPDVPEDGVPPEQRRRRDHPERDDDARPDERQLGLQPWMARGGFGPVRALVDAPLASWFELEVLDAFVR